MKLFSFLTLLTISLFSLYANDTTATVVAGAIQYTQSPEISMDSEVLRISTEQIDISYAFTNHSTKEVTSQVVFPLPPSPLFLGNSSTVFPYWDDLFNVYNFIHKITEAVKSPLEQPSYWSFKRDLKYAAFSNFKRTVDGAGYDYNFVPRAIHADGRDITLLLVENDIPLSAIFVSRFLEEGSLIYKGQKLKQKLQKLGLLDDKEKILWQLQINYVWHQTFPPQKTIHVTHMYRPHVGHHWLSGRLSSTLKDLKFNHRDELKNDQLEVKALKNYCPTKADTIAIEAMFALKNAFKFDPTSRVQRIEHRVQEVRYILSTGANWKGPIKKFRLEIMAPSSSTMVMACFPTPLQKNEQGRYVAELENFTPTSDLKILFINPK